MPSQDAAQFPVIVRELRGARYIVGGRTAPTARENVVDKLRRMVCTAPLPEPERCPFQVNIKVIPIDGIRAVTKNDTTAITKDDGQVIARTMFFSNYNRPLMFPDAYRNARYAPTVNDR